MGITVKVLPAGFADGCFTFSGVELGFSAPEGVNVPCSCGGGHFGWAKDHCSSCKSGKDEQ